MERERLREKRERERARRLSTYLNEQINDFVAKMSNA